MKQPIALTKKKILSLFDQLNTALLKKKISAEINVVGGAVMCLAFNARKSTMDIDGYFLPTTRVRELAADIAKKNNLPTSWLNDGVKGFFSQHGDFSLFWEKSNLKIFVATPEYMLAMKSLSMRMGEEFSDVTDVAYLLRYLNIETIDQAIAILTKYYPKEKFPPKTMDALEDLLDKKIKP